VRLKAGITGQIDGGAFSTKWVIISPKHSIFIINSSNDLAHNEHVMDTLVVMLPVFAMYHKIKNPGFSFVAVDTSDGDQGEKGCLAFCGKPLDVYLIPDRDFMRTKGYIETRRAYQESLVSWDARESVAFWRGSSTGWPLKNGSLRSIQRVSLCERALSSPRSQFYDVGLSDIVQMTDEQKEEISSLNIIKGYVDSKGWLKYKYLIDIDGNTNAWAGLFQRLLSGSTVLKIASPHGYRQWYYDRLVPWENYVPVEADMSDLDDKILWLREHDEQAERIGAAGRDLALSLNYEEEMKKAVEVIGSAFSRPSHWRDGAENFLGADILFSADVRPCRLLTHHETIVFANLADGTLNHGAQIASPENIALFLLSEFGYLMHIAPNGDRHSVIIEPEPDQRLPQSAGRDTTPAPQRFEVVRLLDDFGSVALRREGLFLCAELDGRITLSGDKVGLEEMFRLLEFDPPISTLDKSENPEDNDLLKPDVTTIRTSSSHSLSRSVCMALDRAIVGESKLISDILSIEGMSGKKYRMFINNLISSLDDARYLEIGVWAGSTLCSAIFGNKISALAIDNWSQFGGPKEKFLKNLAEFRGETASVSFLEQDFREIDYEKIGKFNVYLFDGPHEEEDQYDCIKMALPALDEHFVLIVDDWNWEQVRRGTLRSIAASHLHVDYFAEIRTTRDNSHPTVGGSQSDWHNGYFIACLAKTVVKSLPRVPPEIDDSSLI